MLYKVVQIWPGLIAACLHTNQSRSYLSHLVLISEISVFRHRVVEDFVLLRCYAAHVGTWWLTFRDNKSAPSFRVKRSSSRQAFPKPPADAAIPHRRWQVSSNNPPFGSCVSPRHEKRFFYCRITVPREAQS